MVTPDSNDDIVQLSIGINKTASLHRTSEISFFSMPELFELGQKHFRFDQNNTNIPGSF